MSRCITGTCPHERGVFIWLADGPWRGDPADPDYGRYPWVHNTTMIPGHLTVCELMPFATAIEAGEAPMTTGVGTAVPANLRTAAVRDRVSFKPGPVVQLLLFDDAALKETFGPAPEPADSLKGGAPGAADARRASGECGQHDRSASEPVYLHGGPNRVVPGDIVHQDAMPESYGRLQHNFFTTSRQVAEDAADMRDGLGHGWIHTVEPTGSFEPDLGEPDSWKSQAPLRVVSVEPGRMNGTTPHPPVLRQPKTATVDGPAALAGNRASVVELASSSFPGQMQTGRSVAPANSDANREPRSPSYRTRGRRW